MEREDDVGVRSFAQADGGGRPSLCVGRWMGGSESCRVLLCMVHVLGGVCGWRDVP